MAKFFNAKCEPCVSEKDTHCLLVSKMVRLKSSLHWGSFLGKMATNSDRLCPGHLGTISFHVMSPKGAKASRFLYIYL